MIPALDILQSVPVLGFLAITVTFFVALFPGSELGLEAASVFAVFTAQAWNITFSFYHSLISQPLEFDEASKLMGLSRWKRFWTIDVPGGAIGLVWNGMMSFGGSWFFLTASELITVRSAQRAQLHAAGRRLLRRRGRGARASSATSVLGIVTMIIMILVVNFFFWRPLVAYVERFRVEQSEASPKPKSLVLTVAAPVELAGRARPGQAGAWPSRSTGCMGAVTGIDDRSLASARGAPPGRATSPSPSWSRSRSVYGLYSMLAYIAAGSRGPRRVRARPSAWAS